MIEKHVIECGQKSTQGHIQIRAQESDRNTKPSAPAPIPHHSLLVFAACGHAHGFASVQKELE